MTKQAPTDQELSGWIQAGDQRAFRTLFYRYHDSVYRFCYRRLGDEAAAADTAQDVFVKVWEGRSRIDSGKSIRAYLFRLASNQIIDAFRATSIRREHAAGAEIEPTMPRADYFAVEEDVRSAIDALPDPVRKTFVLSRFDELKYAEIARLLGVSVKTVEKRMSNALRILRERLAHLLTVVATILAPWW